MSFLRLSSFLPALHVPPEAAPSAVLGFFILAAIIFTIPFPLHTHPRLPYLRLAIALPAIYFFYDFGFGPYISPGQAVDVGLAVVGLYGIMRVIDTSVIGFWGSDPPKWVSGAKELPLPNTFTGRLAYTVDYCLSLRGTSWFKDTHWDFAPKALVNSNHPRTREKFLSKNLVSLLIQLIIVDILDTFNKSRIWDRQNPHPVTSLSVPLQIGYSISVCGGTALAITVPYTVTSSIFVLLGSHPGGWPPMFDYPFSSTSLADFWTRRWHAIFRRVFERLSLGILWIIPLEVGKKVRAVARAIVIFALSCSLHLFLMYRPDIEPNTVRPPLLDPSILKFFLSQPFALMFEAAVVIPLAHLVFPRSGWARSLVTRVWAWAWLVWSGRFWADVWARRGCWNPGENVVGYSVVRGLWKGEWVV